MATLTLLKNGQTAIEQGNYYSMAIAMQKKEYQEIERLEEIESSMNGIFLRKPSDE